MQLQSDDLQPGAFIDDRFAFGNPDGHGKMRLGQNRNPHLRFVDIPRETKSLALLLVDPDVPTRPEMVNQEGQEIPAEQERTDFYHWLMVDLSPTTTEIASGSCSDEVTPRGKRSPAGPPGSRQGCNDYTDFLAGDEELSGRYFGYDGPCPPWNDLRLHHYHFQLYALDTPRLTLPEGFRAADALEAMAGHVIAEAELVGNYALHPQLRP